jgi:hypothetical protein
MNAQTIVMTDPTVALNNPTIVEMMVAAIAVLAIVLTLWKVAEWLNRRGHVLPPIRAIDIHLPQIKRQAAHRRAKPEADTRHEND